MSQLQDNLIEILRQKNAYLLPENLKKNLTILGITGNLSQNYLSYNTVAELNNDVDNPDIELGQKAVVYGPTPCTYSDEFSYFVTIPKNFTLETAYAGSTIYAYCKNTSSDMAYDRLAFSLSPTEAKFYVSGMMGSSKTLGYYKSTDGINYIGQDEYRQSSYKSTTVEELSYNDVQMSFSSTKDLSSMTDTNEIAYTVLEELCNNVAAIEFNGLYKYSEGYEKDKYLPLMNMTFSSNTFTNGTDENDYLYFGDLLSFIRDEQNIFPSGIIEITDVQNHKPVKGYYYSNVTSGASPYILADTNNNVHLCISNKEYGKYYFDLTNKTWTLINTYPVTGEDTISGYWSSDKYTVRKIVKFDENTQNDIYISMYGSSINYFSEALSPTSGSYLRFSTDSLSANYFTPIQTQFTLPNDGNRLIRGKYIALGKDGVVKSDNTWNKLFRPDEFDAFFDTIAINTYDSYGTLDTPETHSDYNSHLIDAKYITVSELDTLVQSLDGPSDTMYYQMQSTTSQDEVISDAFKNGEPNPNGYLNQISQWSFVDSVNPNIINYLLLPGDRLSAVYLFKINKNTLEYTYTYRTFGTSSYNDKKGCMKYNENYILLYEYTDNNDGSGINVNFTVLNSSTLDVITTFTVPTLNPVDNGWSLSLSTFDVGFKDGQSISANSFYWIASLRGYVGNDTYKIKVAKLENNTWTTLWQPQVGYRSVYVVDYTESGIIAYYNDGNGSKNALFNSNNDRQIYHVSQISYIDTTEGKVKYAYSYNDDPNDSTVNRKVLLDSGEILYENLDTRYSGIITIDNELYYIPTDYYNSHTLTKVSDGTQIYKCLPDYGNGYVFNIVNNTQYTTPTKISMSEDSNWENSSVVYSYSITKTENSYRPLEVKLANSSQDIINSPGVASITNSGIGDTSSFSTIRLFKPL